MSKRDDEGLEQIRLALEGIRQSEQRIAEATRSLREISDLLESLLQTGPVVTDKNIQDTIDTIETYREEHSAEIEEETS